MNKTNSKEDIVELVYSAIDEINLQLPSINHVKKIPETSLIGAEGNLDSLALINFLIDVEKKVKKNYACDILLLDGDFDFNEKGYLSSIDTLSEYLLKCVNEL